MQSHFVVTRTVNIKLPAILHRVPAILYMFSAVSIVTLVFVQLLRAALFGSRTALGGLLFIFFVGSLLLLVFSLARLIWGRRSASSK